METTLDIQSAMAEMRKSGATIKQIAAEFHYSEGGVLYILRKTPNTYKIQQTAEMVKMYQNGFSSVKIAKKFGTSANTVLNRLHKAGCNVNRCRYAKHYDEIVNLYYDGLTAEQIAEKIGCEHTNVLRILKLRGITPRRTDSNLPINAKIKELYENGATIAEIGRQLNMKRNTVDYRLCKMGCKAAKISQTGEIMKTTNKVIKLAAAACGTLLAFTSCQTREDALESLETSQTSSYTSSVESARTSEISGQIEGESPQSAAEVIMALNAFYAVENGIPLLDNSAYYPITGAERYEIERIVASEGGYCPYEFQALVAECILNGCKVENMRPLEIFARGDFWLTHDVEPTEITKQAVSDVFDRGIFPTSEPVRYYYNPNYCKSEVHEAMRYVLTSCDCRFFADWK